MRNTYYRFTILPLTKILNFKKNMMNLLNLTNICLSILSSSIKLRKRYKITFYY